MYFARQDRERIEALHKARAGDSAEDAGRTNGKPDENSNAPSGAVYKARLSIASLLRTLAGINSRD